MGVSEKIRRVRQEGHVRKATPALCGLLTSIKDLIPPQTTSIRYHAPAVLGTPNVGYRRG